METCSFSKYAGFTGTRLGWTVIPDALRFADGSKVQDAFVRVASTVFNGASNLSQAGGLACLQVSPPPPFQDAITCWNDLITLHCHQQRWHGLSLWSLPLPLSAFPFSPDASKAARAVTSFLVQGAAPCPRCGAPCVGGSLCHLWHAGICGHIPAGQTRAVSPHSRNIKGD